MGVPKTNNIAPCAHTQCRASAALALLDDPPRENSIREGNRGYHCVEVGDVLIEGTFWRTGSDDVMASIARNQNDQAPHRNALLVHRAQLEPCTCNAGNGLWLLR